MRPKSRWWWRKLDTFAIMAGFRRCHYCGRETDSLSQGTPLCVPCWRRM